MAKTITIATASLAALPLIHSFAADGRRVCVIIPKKYDVLKQAVIENGTISGLKFSDEDGLYNDKVMNGGLLIAMGYPQKIDTEKLKTDRAINIHFGPLPENRGPDPLFWTLREGKSLAYITLHELSGNIDGGPVLLEKGISIYPGENYGLLTSRLSSLTPPLVRQVIEEMPDPRPQNEEEAVVYARPSQDDLTIRWGEMSAREIENLVNACNPKYNGALTGIDGSGAELRILEVSPAELNLPETEEGAGPGTIVLADNQGLFVQCRDNRFLRLKVVSTNEAILSGQKLAALGVHTGVRFM